MHAWHFAFCTMLQEPNLFNLCCIPIEFVEKESEENIRLLAIWPSLMELLFIFNWICWKFRDFKVWMQMNLPWKRNYQKQSHFILDFSQLLICYLQINPLCQIPFEASKFHLVATFLLVTTIGLAHILETWCCWRINHNDINTRKTDGLTGVLKLVNGCQSNTNKKTN